MSTTVTVSSPEAVCPAASVDEHATVVVPSANSEPAVGLQLTSSSPLTSSWAEVAKAATAPLGPVASTVTLWSVRVGAVVSATVTWKEA